MRITKRIVGLAGVAASMALAGCGGNQAQDMSSGYNTAGTLTNSSNQVSSGTSFGASTLGVKLIPLLGGRPGFMLGMSADSFSGQPDTELGKNPLQPKADVSYDAKAVSTGLKDIEDAGCNVVRLPLFTKLDGLTFDSNGVVTGLDETFTKNLNDLLAKVHDAKLQAYVTLGTPWNEQTTAKDPIADANARTAFFKKAVLPLVENLKGRSGVVALDLIDDIEADVAGKSGNGTKTGVTWDQAHDYIKALAQIVKSVDPQRLVSCGSVMHGTQSLKDGTYSKLGLDFYDVHVYDDQGSLSAVKDLRVDRPVVVGLCGQLSKKVDDSVQATAAYDFLTNAQKQGYAGVILSDYTKNAEDPQSLLTKEGKHRPVFAQLQKFEMSLAMNATSVPSGAGFGTSAFSGPSIGK